MCVAAESQCTDQEVDLVFMLDSSGSIGSRNFEIAREWLISISKSFQIGPTATQIALIQVSETDSDWSKIRSRDWLSIFSNY